MAEAVTNDVRLKLDDDVVVTDEMIAEARHQVMCAEDEGPLNENDAFRMVLEMGWNAALATQPQDHEVVEMSDPKADEATHAYIGDDVDAMRWGRLRQDLAKIPKLEADNTVLKSRVEELEAELSAQAERFEKRQSQLEDTRHSLQRDLISARSERDQALAREEHLREVAKGVAAILEDRAVKQGLHGDLAQAFMSLKESLRSTPPSCQDIEEGESAIIVQQMRDIAKLKDQLSKRDGEVLALKEAAESVIAYDLHGRLIAAKDGDGDRTQNVIFAGEVEELDRLYDVMLAATQKALTSTDQAAQSIEERIRAEERAALREVIHDPAPWATLLGHALDDGAVSDVGMGYKRALEDLHAAMLASTSKVHAVLSPSNEDEA